MMSHENDNFFPGEGLVTWKDVGKTVNKSCYAKGKKGSLRENDNNP